MMALDGKHEAVAELLIENGASMEACNSNGAMPIHFAAQSGMLEIVTKALTRPSTVTPVINQGTTTLIERRFVRQGHKTLISLCRVAEWVLFGPSYYINIAVIVWQS